MWAWWKSKISGEVPLMLNPSEELLLSHERFIKKMNHSEDLILIEDEKSVPEISNKILKNINFFKPVTYIIEGEFLTETGKLIELRLITTSSLIAAYLRKMRMRRSSSKVSDVWTLYHTHLNTLAHEDLSITFPSFALVDAKKTEIWLAGDFATDQMKKVLDYLRIRGHDFRMGQEAQGSDLQSRT